MAIPSIPSTEGLNLSLWLYPQSRRLKFILMAIPSTEGLNLSWLYGYTLKRRLKLIRTAIPSTEGLNLSLWLYPQ